MYTALSLVANLRAESLVPFIGKAEDQITNVSWSDMESIHPEINDAIDFKMLRLETEDVSESKSSFEVADTSL